MNAKQLGTAGGVVIGPRPELTPHGAVYPELSVRNEHPTPAIIFPNACPVCGASVEYGQDGGTGWALLRYKCGGQYSAKPQIQNHTLKWWGRCGDEP